MRPFCGSFKRQLCCVSPHVLACLLDQGADVNKKDNNGDTQLDVAIRYRNTEIVNLINQKIKTLKNEKNQHDES